MPFVDRAANDSFATSHIRWRLAPQWRDRLLVDELRPDSWMQSGQATLIKQGQHRTVYRLDLPQGRFFLKRYHARRSLRRIADALRGSASRREWDKSLLLHARGIATVCPVAVGEIPLGGGSLFLSEELSGACSLAEFLNAPPAQQPHCENASVRLRLFERLAEFVAQSHDAGVSHDDLHPGNIMIRVVESGDTATIQLALIDLPGVRIDRPLGWWRSRQNLVMLRASLDRYASAEEVQIFWRTYCDRRAGVVPRAADRALLDIERRAAKHRRDIHRSREKRCFGINRDFHHATGARHRAFAVREVDRAALLQLANAPQAPLVTHLHLPVKLTRGTQMVEGLLPTANGALPVAYKRYRSRSIWKLLLDQFRGSRARRSWKAGHALLSRGVSTPRPVFCCEPAGRFSTVSYLGTSWIDNARSLHELAWELANYAPHERHRRVALCARSLGELIGQMHYWRFSHRDLKGCNLLVVDRGDQVESYVVDLDCVQRPVIWTRDLAARNLARLATSLQGYAWITRSDCRRFLQAYLQAARCGGDWRWYWKRVARYAGRTLSRMNSRGKAVW